MFDLPELRQRLSLIRELAFKVEKLVHTDNSAAIPIAIEYRCRQIEYHLKMLRRLTSED
jgi:hypothetical protein